MSSITSLVTGYKGLVVLFVFSGFSPAFIGCQRPQREIASRSEFNTTSTAGYQYLPLIFKQSQFLEPFYGIEFVPVSDFEKLKELNIEVVLLVFPHDSDIKSWKNYLDEAQTYNLRVIGRLWPEGWMWNGTDWQIDEKAHSFIRTLAEHPATLAVYSLEEPYWQGCWGCGYTTPQLQLLYEDIKAIADVPVYAEVGSMSFWTDRGEETAFADGICDYCANWYYPFQADGTYKREELISSLTADLSVAMERAPDSKFIWLMQSFAQRGTFRMPTAEEMIDLASIVYDMEVDGALWYSWWSGPIYNDFLSNHPELYPVVGDIYKEIVLPFKN